MLESFIRSVIECIIVTGPYYIECGAGDICWQQSCNIMKLTELHIKSQYFNWCSLQNIDWKKARHVGLFVD